MPELSQDAFEILNPVTTAPNSSDLHSSTHSQTLNQDEDSSGTTIFSLNRERSVTIGEQDMDSSVLHADQSSHGYKRESDHR